MGGRNAQRQHNGLQGRRDAVMANCRYRDQQFRAPPKIGHVERGIAGHVRPESSVTMGRNRRSRCSGIRSFATCWKSTGWQSNFSKPSSRAVLAPDALATDEDQDHANQRVAGVAG